VNRQPAGEARIRRFLLLYKELDADDEGTHPHQKIRRGFINTKLYPGDRRALRRDGESSDRNHDPLSGRKTTPFGPSGHPAR